MEYLIELVSETKLPTLALTRSGFKGIISAYFKKAPLFYSTKVVISIQQTIQTLICLHIVFLHLEDIDYFQTCSTNYFSTFVKEMDCFH